MVALMESMVREARWSLVQDTVQVTGKVTQGTGSASRPGKMSGPYPKSAGSII